jgi:hypothetical protein
MANSKEPSSGFDYGSNTRKWAGYDFDTHGGVEAQYKLRMLIFTI